jgi:hypothetical protein
LPENNDAKELRRQQQQGLGKAIDSWEQAGTRYVRVNGKVYQSSRWRTFEDFLFNFVNHLLTPEWTTPELAKPVELQHPLIQWYVKLCTFQQQQSKSTNRDVYFSTPTGAVKAYLHVAYNLYLCAHNEALIDSLLVRLRNKDQFEGALYETYVIASFIKSGFKIELEDESDSTVSHCEFTAINQKSGRTFSVEAKATTLSSERSGHGIKPPRVRDRLFKALKKKSSHERIVFIELNRAEEATRENLPDWLKVVDEELKQAELDFKIEENPSAYVFVTNHNFMHWLDSPSQPEFQFAAGYKIPDFPPYKLGECTMAELVAAREKHREILHLLDALNVYAKVPSTFDDRAPEEVFDDAQPPQVGQKSWIPDVNGVLVQGELISGQVLEPESMAYCQFRTDKGFCIVTLPLTPAEMAIYRRSPQTFFGVVQQAPNTITEPHECFDFIYSSFKNTSKEVLLKLVESWPDFHTLKKLDQHQLAKIYSERAATDMWLDGQNSSES